MPETPGSTPLKRACDACHRRKVKCLSDVGPSCKNCGQANLKCTYNAIPQKKGPKGSRAKVISELRETQRLGAATAKPDDHFDFLHPPVAPCFERALNFIPPDLIDVTVDYFFDQVYATQPIITRALVQDMICEMHENVESYCLIVSLCAYMLIQPNIHLPETLKIEYDLEETQSVSALGVALLAEVKEARKSSSYQETPTLVAVTTSFFLFGCYFCLEKHNLAYFHLREATTLALLMGMGQETTYASGDSIESTNKRRLFWLLFVTERAYALQMQRPLTLHATIELPNTVDDPLDAARLTGFNHLVALYKPFDNTFVGLWNQSITGATTDWLVALQKQLTAALPQYLDGTETQAVDLTISQQWLRVMIWQLSISNRLLSSSSPEQAMSFRYPVDLSRELAAEASGFPLEAMEVHGIGFIKKLFDIACTLIDVMAYVPMEMQGFEIGPRDYLQEFIRLMSRIRGGNTRYLPLLVSKAQDILPGIAGHVITPSIDSTMSNHLDEYSVSGDGDDELDVYSNRTVPSARRKYSMVESVHDLDGMSMPMPTSSANMQRHYDSSMRVSSLKPEFSNLLTPPGYLGRLGSFSFVPQGDRYHV